MAITSINKSGLTGEKSNRLSTFAPGLEIEFLVLAGGGGGGGQWVRGGGGGGAGGYRSSFGT